MGAGCDDSISEAGSAGIALDTVAAIGVLEGDPRLTFGRITDVATDADGHFYLVDVENKRLTAVDRDGQLLAAAGREGEGPGEFGHPERLAVDASGDVRILDRRNLDIKRFRLNGDTLRYLDALSVRRLNPNDLCMLGDRLYLQGWTDGELVHEVDSTGAILRSFGEPFLSDPDHPYLAQSVDSGEIACVEDLGLVLLMARQVPVLRAYSAAGQELWSRRLSGFNAMTIEPNPGGGVRYSEPEDGGRLHLGVSVLGLSDGVGLVQFGRSGSGYEESITDVRSHLFALETGEVLSRSDSLPRLDGARGRTAWGHPALPYPRLVLYQYALADRLASDAGGGEAPRNGNRPA